MTYIKRHIFIFIFVLSAIWGCGRSSGDSNTVNATPEQSLIIEPYKERCGANSHELCYLIKRTSDDRPKVYAGEFTGLQYEWGRRYTVAFKRESENTLEVTEILNAAQESVEDAFLIQLSGNKLRVLDDCLFAIGDEVKFAASSSRLCRQLRTLAKTGTEKLFEFSFTGSAVIPIRLESLGPANGEHRE